MNFFLHKFESERTFATKEGLCSPDNVLGLDHIDGYLKICEIKISPIDNIAIYRHSILSEAH